MRLIRATGATILIGALASASALAQPAMIPQRFITAGFGGSGIQESDPKLRAQAEALDAALPKAQGEDAAGMERFRSRVAQVRPANSAPVSASPLQIDVTALTVPILAVNGSFDSPYSKTQ